MAILLAEEVDLMCGTHDVPIGDAAKVVLAELLALDWSAMPAAGHLPFVGGAPVPSPIPSPVPSADAC